MTAVVEDQLVAESLMDWGADIQVDEEAGIIRNVLLCGNTSRNGYNIPPEAFGSEARVKSLYEGRHVYWSNHPDRLETAHTRPVELVAAYVKNVRIQDGRPRGDLHADGLPKGENLLRLAKSRVPNVGLSHVAAYTYDETKTRVRSVDQVLALDVVTHPATTRSFSEQTKVSPPMSDANDKLVARYEADLKELRAENQQLTSALKDLENKLKAEQDRLTAELETVQAERDDLSGQVEKFEAEQALNQRRQWISESLKKHKLDEGDKKVCSEAFIGNLMRIDDDSEREGLIKDRADVFASAVKGESTAVLSAERNDKGVGDGDDIDALLKKLVRG